MELVGDSPSHQQPKKSKTQIPITSTQSSNAKPEFVYPILLPLDIISEILSRLPVKPLSRFRCVSKEWCSLISSSEFVKLHLKALDFRKDYAHHKILSSFDRSQTFSFKQCSLQSVISEPVTESVELDYPTKSPNISPWIVGSCNGLVCIEIDWDLYIWNPTTGKFKKVDSSYILGFRFGYRYLTYGFGYDKLNDDYKVFWVLGSSCENENKVMVYSLRNDFWRIIGGLKGEVLVESTNKCVNGKIHFAVRPSFSSSSSSRWEIVSLDLATEVYGRVEQPNYGEIESYLTLEVISGYLCVLCEYQRTHTDLWVMREYGVNESWTKMLTNRPFDMIVTIPPLNDPWNKCFSFPFCISKNGEVVLVLDSTIVVYDPKTKVLRYPEITNFGGIFEAEIYVESLVSPIAYSESRREQQH